MNAPKFTPGPWIVTTGKNRLVGPCPGKAVAVCNYDNGPVEKANANLIAAAPELYEALDGLRTVMACHDSTPEEFLALANAVAALAKAVQP